VRKRGDGMNARQTRIIRILQFIFYPLAAIMLLAFALDFFRVWTGAPPELVTEEERGGETDWVGLGVVLLFWVVFLALAIEFLAREIFRLRPRDGLGRVILELGRSKGPARFVALLAAAVFVAGLNIIIFRPDLINIDPQQASLTEHLAFWLFYGIAHLLLVVFLLRAIRNRPFLVVTDTGFLYEPGDISPGLIRWEDVTEIKEAELLARAGSAPGPTTRPVLAVGLRNADAYSARYTPLLGLLNRLLTKGIKYQTGGPGDVVIAAEDLGARYVEIRDLMLKLAHQRDGGRTG
jgi:hypothetical protein